MVEPSDPGPLPPSTNVIDVLFAHRDTDGELTMPRFLAKKLWEYFAYPSPSKALIDEIAAYTTSSGLAQRIPNVKVTLGLRLIS